ncbi:MAG: hypothetical protein HYY19_04555 [Candidatus Rokubacteria bacterium]|nr:hypothetical protein [Candidatus Rokubacteria bacterium]
MGVRVEALGLTSIQELNTLPEPVREALYLRLVPEGLWERLAIDRRTLRNAAGEPVARVVAPAGQGWARVEVRATGTDRDPLLVVDVEMSPLGVPELTFVQITDPAGERYGIDRDDDGQDTLFGTIHRNLGEETRALAAGLAPGQVRRGFRLLGRVLEAMEAWCRLLGREIFLVEPLFYHSAILYERHGCAYLLGRERMEEIDQGFRPGGPLAAGLDGSTPFRQPGFARTVRGRSWAIHDGILGEPWAGVKMYKEIGRHAGLATFTGAEY